MSQGLLALVACVYIYVALDYYTQGRTGMALAFSAYALSNIGFMLDMWRQ